jgi:hypothetical protein
VLDCWSDVTKFIDLYGYTIKSFQYDKISPIKSVHKNKISPASGGRALSTSVSTIFLSSEKIPRLEYDLGKKTEVGNRPRKIFRGWNPTSENITRLETDLGKQAALACPLSCQRCLIPTVFFLWRKKFTGSAEFEEGTTSTEWNTLPLGYTIQQQWD